MIFGHHASDKPHGSPQYSPRKLVDNLFSKSIGYIYFQSLLDLLRTSPFYAKAAEDVNDREPNVMRISLSQDLLVIQPAVTPQYKSNLSLSA